jgi:hypothetical protein
MASREKLERLNRMADNVAAPVERGLKSLRITQTTVKLHREETMAKWDAARKAIAEGCTSSWPRDWFESELDARDERIAQLEAFEKSIRHAAQLFRDGFASSGESQVLETVRHLDKLRQR